MEVKIKRSRVKTMLDLFTSKQWEINTSTGLVRTSLAKLGGMKFGYFVQRNVDKLISEVKHQENFRVDLMQKYGTFSEDYLREERELFEKYALRNDKGEPHSGLRIDATKADEFEAERATISEKYPEDAKKNAEFTDMMEKYMEEELTIDFYGIRKEELPEIATAEIINFIIDYVIE